MTTPKQGPKKLTAGSLKVLRSKATSEQRGQLFWMLCTKSAFAIAPEREVVFHADRKWRFDFAWPEQRVAVESEGGVFINGAHNRGAKFLKDAEKYNEAAIAGWCVLRVASHQLCTPDTLTLVQRALSR